MQIQTFNYTNINFQKYSPEVIKKMEESIETLYAQNLSRKDIAETINTTEAFVRKSLQKLCHAERSQKAQQLKANKLKKSENKINKKLSLGLEMLILQKQGLTVKEIAHKLNHTEGTVRGYLQFFKKKILDLLV